MFTKRILVAVAACLTLVAGCAKAAPAATTAPIPSQAPSSAAATSAPASTSQAPQAGADVGAFMDKVVAAQKAVKTYTITMHMETPVSGKATKMSFKGAVDQSDPSSVNMSMEMDLGGTGKMTVLKIDGDMYLQMGATGKTWMKVPKSQMKQYEGTTDSTDITAGMEKARGSMKKIEQLGDEAVDGVNTHHYRITMDAKALSEISGAKGSIADKDFDYDVWIDDASLMRKVAMEVTAKADGEDLPLKMDATMGNYGEPVSIKAPAAKDVVKLGG